MCYVPMNVNIPPFNNLKARQAVNYAIDRKAAVKIYGGTNLALPVCQILPPGFPGYQPYCQYTKNPGTTWSAPDLAKAKALMAPPAQTARRSRSSPTTGRRPALGTYLASVLNKLGFDASTHVLSAEHPVHLHPEHQEQGADQLTHGTRTIPPPRTS